MATEIAAVPKTSEALASKAGDRLTCTVASVSEFKNEYNPNYCTDGGMLSGFLPRSVGTLNSGVRVRFLEIAGEFTLLTDSRSAGLTFGEDDSTAPVPRLEVGQVVTAVFDRSRFRAPRLVAVKPNDENGSKS